MIEYTLKNFLEIENTPEILKFQCRYTDLPIWPQVRAVFFRILLSDIVYHSDISGKSKTNTTATRQFATLIKAFMHNVKRSAQGGLKSDICITGTNIADIVVNGKYFNRLTDPVGVHIGNEVIYLLNLDEYRDPFPRFTTKIYIHSPIQAYNSLAGYFLVNRLHKKIANELINLVTDRSSSIIGYDINSANKQKLVNFAAGKIAALPYAYNIYSKLLKKMSPYIIFIEQACYGPMAAFVAAAKDLGIVTAELQHGSISSGHDAYNFADIILVSDIYQRALPDFFLGYGDWWLNQINARVQKIAIGNPYREHILNGLATTNRSRNKIILVLSDGIVFDLYLNLCQCLACALDLSEFTIKIRPHPLEREFVCNNHHWKSEMVSIDLESNIYVSMSDSYAVVSEISTGLFEAIGITERILVWNTYKTRFTYTTHPFETFNTCDDLIQLLQTDFVGGISEEVENSIWKKSWQRNFDEWMATITNKKFN